MKKIQEYVIKNKKIYIGLEDSKRTWRLCVRCEGIIVHEVSMPTEYINLRNYLSGKYPGCEIHLIYEAGFKGFWLHDLLEDDGIDCIVTPPNKVTQEKDSRIKNDRVDAKRLSKNLENGDFRSCFVPDTELREDRQISRTLVMIQKDITRTMNRIRKFFNFHGVRVLCEKKAWSVSDYKSISRISLGESLRFSLNILSDELDHLLEYRQLLKKRLQEMTKKERYTKTFHHFESCPGIGWLTAIRLVLEWGEDLSRFETGKHLSSYLGLTASEYSTGETIRRGRITAQSHEFVRSWLTQCSWVAIRRDPVLQKKFQDVWKNTGSKKKAIVAVARKLSVRLRHLAVYDEDYELGLIEEQSQSVAA
jgi:transposase